MPPELVHVLRTARRLEGMAATQAQRRAAIRATLVLLRACADAGWRGFELADLAGLAAPAVRQRVSAARRRGDHLTGLHIPEPLVARRPLALLATPVEQREWLRIDEAARLARVSRATLRSWRRAGLLPNTHWVTARYPLGLRADLLRVLRAPRDRYGRGVDHQAVRVLLDQAAV